MLDKWRRFWCCRNRTIANRIRTGKVGCWSSDQPPPPPDTPPTLPVPFLAAKALFQPHLPWPTPLFFPEVVMGWHTVPMFGSWSSATTVISNKLLFWSVAWAGFELGSLVLQGAFSNHSAITLRSVFQLLAINFNFYKIVHCQQNNFFPLCGIVEFTS